MDNSLRKDFEQSNRKLVFVSDCHGTIVSPVNMPLFLELIRAREDGHTVIITSSAYNLQSVTRLMLQAVKKPETFFDVEIDGEVHSVILKKNLSEALGKLGIEKADFVFDDEDPQAYLRSDQIICHVDPKDFAYSVSKDPHEIPSGDYVRFRLAFPDAAP